MRRKKIGRLIARFAVPAIISMLVSSLYNIVDQIFIGQGVGMLGNAATNIAFPVSIICTATALLLGIGSASNYNLEAGAGRNDRAAEIAGNGLAMLVICGVVIGAVVLIFLNPLLHLFGVTKEILSYAQDYTGITAIGIPFLILTTGGNHLISCGQKSDVFYDLYVNRSDPEYNTGSAIYLCVSTGASKVQRRQL